MGLTCKPDTKTGAGYGVNDKPVIISGEWSKQDIFYGLYGHTPKGLGSPDVHHTHQMPGSGIHKVIFWRIEIMSLYIQISIIKM